MAKKLFTTTPYNSYDKEIQILGPDDLRIMVDYDDVDHEQVDQQIEQLLDTLNKHWAN